ncbi:MAG: hypothetical protein H6999_07820 [Hahellaceae bacterium]|nr:hypothetical protein [Hahellaceae bacterium]MCP5169649.1 hypothetical protein [Hahellaceae bacterium]
MTQQVTTIALSATRSGRAYSAQIAPTYAGGFALPVANLKCKQKHHHD